MDVPEASSPPGARRRFDPMSTAWPIIVADVVAVLIVTTGCFALASLVGHGWAGVLAYQLIGGAVLMVTVALPLRYFLVQQRDESERREAILLHEVGRREFAARLNRALDMAGDESAVLAAVGRAFDELAPTALVEVLLADSSQAHILRAAESVSVGTDLSGCTVSTPHGCPAVRNGHTMRFADSDRLDACPHLVGRGHGRCGAVCVPVGIMGSTVGVVHEVHLLTDGPDEQAVEGLEVVAHQLGARIGVLTAMSQSQIQANTDPLTGLLNRRSLENEVHALMRKGTTFALIFADLDHFKQLNDTHGHDMGDRALRLFAHTLRRAMPDPALVARYGGEEFVIAVPDSDAAGAVRSFDRVREELEKALADGRVPPFTVSAGIVDDSYNETVTLDEMISMADAWLLRAKSTGRNKVLWGGQADNVVAFAPAQAPAQ